MNEIDTMNKFLVSVRGDHIVVLNPPRMPITNADALNLAAWLVVLVGADREEFESVLRAVMNT
jgi:hypothetical protein